MHPLNGPNDTTQYHLNYTLHESTEKIIIRKFAMYSLDNKYNGYIRIFHQVTKERNLTSTIFEYYS